MSAAEQFRAVIAAAGLRPPDKVIADGKLHRFSTNGRGSDDGGWYVFHGDGVPAGQFGDWRTGVSETWHADVGRRLTPAEKAAHRAKLKEIRRVRQAEEAQRHAEAREQAVAIWNAATPVTDKHAYLTRKQVRAYGLRGGSDGRVILPMEDVDGRLHSLQFIDSAGEKLFLAGGRVKGCCHVIGTLNGASVACITEGYATAATEHMATGYPVAVAFTAGNLLAVAKAMRAQYPNLRLVLCADDDAGTAGNPGLTKATEAALAVGGWLAVPDFGADRPAKATDFNDVMMHRGLEAVAEAIMHARPVNDDDVKLKAEWPEPLPLIAVVEPEPYPIDALPAVIRSAVKEVQAFVQAPVSLVASCALSAVSLAVQAHVDVKREDKLVGPSSLNLLDIAESGERKTTCDGFFTTAIEQYEQQQREQFEPVIIQYKADLDAWTANRNGLLDLIRAEAKKQKDTGAYKDRLRELETAKPKAPRVPKLLRGDDTPENLAWSLATSWPSAGVLSSEAGLILGAHGMGRESIMRNLALLNILWDGKTHDIGRRTSESFTLRGARFTVGLQVQEAALRSFFEDSKGLARGMGFFARPESTQGYRPFREAPAAWPALARFHRRLSEILNMPVPIDDTGVLTPIVLPFTPEAKGAWIAYHDAIESELRTGGELYDVRDVASKSADNAARLAALFQVFEHSPGAIGLDAFQRAARIAAWHLNESRRFFGLLALPIEVSDAARLDTWLLGYCRRESVTRVPVSIVQKCGPSGLRGKVAIEGAVGELAELHRARLVKSGKAKVVEVNPALLSGTRTAKTARTATAEQYAGGAAWL